MESVSTAEESKLAKIPPDAYVLIIGAMRCGTSSLFNYLVQHPEICPSIRKEPEFFSEHQQHRFTGVDRYEDLWKFDPAAHRYALEASTGYTKFPEEMGVPQRIHDYGIRPKFIYIVRNPFDRIRSQYEHMTGKLGLPVSASWSSDTFVSLSNYYLQLQQYRTFFPRESFLIVNFDELATDPRSAVIRVCRFLGISDDRIPSRYPVHHQTVSPAETLVSRNSVLQRISSSLPAPIRRFGKRVSRGVSKRRDWNERERLLVEERLTADMYHFQEEYGFDISKWGWKPPATRQQVLE